MIAAAAAVAALSMQADRPSSALETLLVERVCDAMVATRTIQAADHEKCVDDQLASLRADLGSNLARLSAGDRQRLDAACSHLAGALTREAYLDCVNAQLAPVRERLRRTTPASADPVVPVPVSMPAPNAPVAPPGPPTRGRALAIGGGSLLVLITAAGAAVAIRKRKPARHFCGSCGTAIAGGGGLCADCRHQAADALRRATAERAAAEESAARREREAAAGAAAAAEQEWFRHELVKQAAVAEEARRREAEEAARRRHVAAAQGDTVSADAQAESRFDPHAILGIAKDASADAIRAAYDEARTKYDPEQVSHLSPEVQQHYRDKAQAVERAFRMLS